jgi:exosortase
VLAALGPRGLRLLALPLAMLLFMVPLPQFVLREVSHALQLLSSELGVALIRAFGISVHLAGNVIDLGAYKLQVVEACNGLRYLFPLMVLGTLAACFFQAPMWQRVLLVVSTVPDVARVARGAAVGVMGQEFMEAGRAVGLRNGTLIWRYLTLNCISTIAVFLTLRFGQVILVGSALGFLGMGAQPPVAELGMMAAQGRDFLFMAPHIATIPSLAIFVIVLTANLLGDAVRDVLDPRLQT